ncbi:hypothetical protein WJX72_008837 [[Myrmecia] bisecta]|uniref:Leydig cell tumor 10 kDa protein homolog n=1 Tax=[Myrmecia] bisecta TaxID=41462 RepID=A0AAW1R7J7_9CHLO
MAQKPLFKSGKKKQEQALAANRHGKLSKTKRGSLQRAPKKEAAKLKHKDEKELTQIINAKNEEALAGKAAQAGGAFAVVRAPQTAEQQRNQASKKPMLVTKAQQRLG